MKKKLYRHAYTFGNEETWEVLFVAYSYKEAMREGNIYAREHARERKTRIMSQSTKYLYILKNHG